MAKLTVSGRVTNHTLRYVPKEDLDTRVAHDLAGQLARMILALYSDEVVITPYPSPGRTNLEEAGVEHTLTLHVLTAKELEDVVQSRIARMFLTTPSPGRPYNKCWLCDEDHRGLPCPRSLPSCSVSVVDQQRAQH